MGHTGERANGWQHPDTKKMVAFEDVLAILSKRAEEIQRANPEVEGLRVIGIDFRVASEGSFRRHGFI